MVQTSDKIEKVLKGKLKDAIYNHYVLLYHLKGEKLGEGPAIERIINRTLISEGSTHRGLQKELERYAQENSLQQENLHFLKINFEDGNHGIYDRNLVITENRGAYYKGNIDWFFDMSGRGADLYPTRTIEVPYSKGLEDFFGSVKNTKAGFQD